MEVKRLIEWLEKHFPEYALELTIEDYMRFMLSDHNTHLSAWSNRPSLRQELYTEGIPTRQCVCSRDNSNFPRVILEKIRRLQGSSRRAENPRPIQDFCELNHFILRLRQEFHQEKVADRKCQRVCCTP